MSLRLCLRCREYILRLSIDHQSEQKEKVVQPQNKLQTLTQMGFDHKIAAIALTECADDIETAIQFLFAMQSAQTTPNALAQSNDVDVVCYCQSRLTKLKQYRAEWTCQTCLRSFNVDVFYYCAAEKCAYRGLSGVGHYTVCTQCANAIQPDDHKSHDASDAAEPSTLFKKLSSTLSRISSVTHIKPHRPVDRRWLPNQLETNWFIFQYRCDTLVFVQIAAF